MILYELKRAGVKLAIVGDRIRLGPPSAVNPALLEKVTEKRAALIKLWADHAYLKCYVCRGNSFWRGEPNKYTDGTTGPSPWVCRVCHPPPNENMVKETLP